jgi:hypothetical protein
MDGATRLNAGYAGDLSADWTIRGMADFNGDGKADILAENTSNGAVSVWEMDGAQAISKTYVKNLGAGESITAITDVNGDGQADIQVTNANTNGIAFWEMDEGELKRSVYGGHYYVDTQFI